MLDELRRNDRVSRRTRTDLRQLADAKAILPAALGGMPTTGREMKDVAADFGVTPSRISQLRAEVVLRPRAELAVAA